MYRVICAIAFAAATTLSTLGVPAVAAKPTPAKLCAILLKPDQLPDSFDENTKWVDDQNFAFLAPSSVQRFNSFIPYVRACPAGPDRDLVTAYMSAWDAAFKHHNDDSEWRTRLNLARQLFQRCVVRSLGTDRGARCESAEQRITAWLVAWSTPTPSP